MSKEEVHSSADVAARRCLERLLSSFPGRPERLLVSDIYEPTGYPLIGLEVELKWSSFFPELYDRFLSNGRSYQDLSGTDALELTRLCTEQEKILDIHRKLELGLECGLGRGRDCYWEHVLPPTTEPKVLVDILGMLASNGMLPAGNHSMQFTVGSVKPGRLLYFALLALELRTSRPLRILSAFHPTEPAKTYSWAKKGRAGIFVKIDWDLKHENTACELRTLELDTSYDLDRTMTLAFNAMKGVVDIQEGKYTREARAMQAFMYEATKQLSWAGLPDCNWEKPNQQPEVWRRFAEVMPGLRWALDDQLNALFLL